MLNGRAKTLFFLFCTFSVLSHSAPSSEVLVGLQLAKENVYKDTAGPFFEFYYKPSSFLKLKSGSGVFLSRTHLESLIYCIELEAKPLSWISFLVRGSHRSQIQEDFSGSSFLSLLRLEAFSGRRLSFFGSGGWYHRWIMLNHSSLLPFAGASSFTQHDFATELGFKLGLSRTLETQLRLSTFDNWDVYNLNNPFIESAFWIGDTSKSAKWLATFRYQLLLGFGRLDRLVFGLFYFNRW